MICSLKQVQKLKDHEWHQYELTDDDVRRRLKELEQWYGMSSDEFYRRWKRGEADDIFEKIEWSALYEEWVRIEAES